MNKYQKSLDKFCNQCYCGNCDNELEPCKEKELLQELVDKATPKKTIKQNFEDDRYNCYKHSCPTCGYCWVCDIPNYCPECGQALDKE